MCCVCVVCVCCVCCVVCVPCSAWINGPVQADHIIVRLSEVLQTIMAILCKNNLGQKRRGEGSGSDSYQ